mmetsp:Transcript_39584/g.77936  ORF Transcript_39584/g.77936 Transcript_39584/m.77936 type:complete len:241 (-) Transcript_39584:62-784(-)
MGESIERLGVMRSMWSFQAWRRHEGARRRHVFPVLTLDAAKAISPLSVGDRVVVSDPCPSGISGQSVCGKDAIFCGVESSSVVCVLVKTKSGKGWRPLHVHPSAVSLKSWYGLDVSGDFLHDDDKRKELVDDELDRFSDFSVDDEEEIDISADGGDLPEAVLSSSRAQAHLPQQVTQAAVRQLERVLAAARARSNGVSRRCHSWSGLSVRACNVWSEGCTASIWPAFQEDRERRRMGGSA